MCPIPAMRRKVCCGGSARGGRGLKVRWDSSLPPKTKTLFFFPPKTKTLNEEVLSLGALKVLVSLELCRRLGRHQSWLCFVAE